MLFRLSISFISAAVIAYEILLMRLLSIIQWHSFAYMILSLALLGFGTSGTFIACARRWLLDRFIPAFPISAALFGIFTAMSFAIAQRVPFNALEIIWDARQLLYLLSLYLLLFLPFFFAANCIGLAFAKFGDQINRIYLFDLVGAGAGALAIVAALFVAFPHACLRFVGALPFFAAALSCMDRMFGVPKRYAPALVACGIVIPILWPRSVIDLRLSEYKSLRMALLVPDTEVVEERSSPLGLVSLVRSPLIPFRQAPGLSLRSKAELPEQMGIFTDGDSLSMVTRYDGDRNAISYLDDLTLALPYHLLSRPSVLVLGAGGGDDVLSALFHDAEEVDAVELNPQVVELARRGDGDFKSEAYGSEGVNLFVEEARGFVTRSEKRYDLIQVALLDSFSASSAGLYALSESYLYTVEALREYIGHLKPEGMLAITRWLKVPPRDSLKMFAMAVGALEGLGVSDPGRRLVLIRSWKTWTMLVKNGDFLPADIDAVRAFCEDRFFDVSYYPGMEAGEANRFSKLDEPYLFEGAMALLGREREDFIDRYKYNIAPATDERPYFFNFFTWGALPEIVGLRGRGGAPLMEWGYPILAATLIQAIAVGFVLIIIPLWVFKRRGVGYSGWAAVLVYFCALGLAFMFIEIAFIQRFILFLSHPIYAVAVVLASFLTFAGIGSGLSARLARRLAHGQGSNRRGAIALAVAGIALLAVLYLIVLPNLFSHLAHLSDAGRIAASVILIAPLAFLMGMPFPLGLACTAEGNPRMVPWAWGINGCASVISPIIATLLAIHLGFTAVVGLAMALYILVALVIRRIS